MCSISAVSDYYMNTYPGRSQFQQPPAPGNLYHGLGGPPSIVHTFDQETKELMRQALKLLDKIDKRLGDVECLDDAKKAFLRTLNLDPEDIGAE